ncbi:MAG: prephenate dehydrogenase dimerization domain-containing protein, partial [bacterium]|nr:prephenate dehydrogenase dimerization domain-containing protein [bacterium]
GNPELGRMMAEYNQTALLDHLYSYQQTLQDLIMMIEQGQWQEIQTALEVAQHLRPLYVRE